MKTISVKASENYDILIDSHLLENCGELVSRVTQARHFAVIADSNTAPLYADTVVRSLHRAGADCDVFTFDAGESSKNIDTLARIYAFLAENHFTRSDAVIALGGGVTGDMAGFAAASYLRGMDMIQIPTSLLAMVDSSVGGKTAIDIPQGKNLVGAFKQPKMVLIDTDVLETLPEYYFIDGMGEIVKYGMIRSRSLFETLLSHDKDSIKDIITDVICECVSIKRDVVENDEFDHGERALLNFGHTLGHSIEKYYNYSGISHGRAVAKGMQLITDIAARQGLCDEGLSEKLAACLAKYDLIIDIEPSVAELADATLNDKKRTGNTIGIVVVHDVGDSSTVKMPMDDFIALLKG